MYANKLQLLFFQKLMNDHFQFPHIYTVYNLFLNTKEKAACSAQKKEADTTYRYSSCTLINKVQLVPHVQYETERSGNSLLT